METQATTGEASPPTASATSNGRWWAAVVTGVLVAVPFGRVLSYGGALPFMLGLFFFALFGLLIGAVMYRVGSPARPIPARHITIGTTIVIAVCFSISLVKEARDFPADAAGYVVSQVQLLPEGMSADDLERDAISFVRARFGDLGGPVLGYIRWSIGSSRIVYPVETMADPLIIRPSQHRWWWGVRVVMSVGLLAFGIYSQVVPLTRLTDRIEPDDES